MSQIKAIKPNTSFELDGVKYITLNDDAEKALDKSYSDIIKFMSSNEGKNKSEEVKDELYAQAKGLCDVFKTTLDATKYNFNLNRTQLKFLSDLILNKLEYDTTTVFVAIELNNIFIEMNKAKFSGEETQSFSVTATEITYIYHLISSYKIKGLCKDAFTFTEVLRKIGDISKLVNYYDNQSKNLGADVQDWVALFDENVTSDKPLFEIEEEA